MMKVLLGIGAVTILLVILVILLPFIVDLNQYQAQYQPVIEDALNRKVVLQDIRLTIWPRIGARVGGFTVMDDPAYSAGPFASLSSLDVGVKLMPLLSGKVAVEEITLRDPVITVIKNRNGVMNVSTISPKGPAKPQPQHPEAPPAPPTGSPLQALALLAVDHVAITGGKLTYRDESTPKPTEYIINDLDFLLTSVHLGGTPSLHLAATVQPYSLPVKVDGTFGPLAETLDVTNFDFIFALGKTPLALKGSAVGGNLDATLTSPLINTADLPLALPLTNPVHVKDLHLIVHANYPPKPEASPMESADIKDLGLAIVLGNSVINVKGNASKGVANVTATSSSIQSANVPISLPLTKPIEVKDLRLTARANYPPKEGTPPLKLADVTDLGLAVAMGNSVADVKGTVLNGHAKVNVTSKAINTADLPVALPLKKPVDVKDLQVLTELKGQDARLNNLSFQVFNGQVKAQGGLTLGTPAAPFDGKVSVRGLQLGPVLEAVGTDKVSVSGTAATDLALRGRGFSAPELTQTLEGTGHLAIKDGKLEGINLMQEALTLLKVVGIMQDNVKATVFSTIEGDVAIKQGIINLQRLQMDSHDFRATALGTIGFDQTLNLKASLKLSEALSKQITGKSPAAKLILTGGRIVVPLVITGTTQVPSYSLDTKAIGGKLQEQVKEQAKEKVGEILKSKSGEEALQKGQEALKQLFGR